MSRINHTTTGYTLLQWIGFPDYFTCVELNGNPLPSDKCDVVVLRDGKFYDFGDNTLCAWAGELVEKEIVITAPLLVLSMGDSFLHDGVLYEVAENWDVWSCDTIECVNVEELRYVEKDPYLKVQVVVPAD